MLQLKPGLVFLSSHSCSILISVSVSARWSGGDPISHSTCYDSTYGFCRFHFHPVEAAVTCGRCPQSSADPKRLHGGANSTTSVRLPLNCALSSSDWCPSGRLMRAQSTIAPVAPVVAPDSQVVQVLTTAAQRVAQEAQSQVVASPNDAGPELQALAKQQHVLTVTAQAFNSKMAGEGHDGSGSQSNALTAAAQQVVLQAARQVAADRTVAAVSSGMPSSPSTVASQVTVKDVSVATQSAVAQAVDMVGPLSSEVDVLMTASSLLQQQTRLPSQNMLDSQLAASDPNRTLASVTAPPQYGMPLSNSVPVFFHS